MAPKIAPFGTWLSPISSSYVAKAGVSFDDVLVEPLPYTRQGLGIYHIEKRPSEAGRNALVDTTTKKDLFGKGFNARSSVHEYGGASATVHGGRVYFSNFADGRVYRIVLSEEGAEPVPITPANVEANDIENSNYRFANFAVHSLFPHLVVCILEDHTHPEPSEVLTSLVTIDAQSAAIHPLVSGADFYSSPAFNAEGTRLAWVQWNHPDMPWDGAQVYAAEVLNKGYTLALQNVQKIKGEWKKESAVQPRWTGTDTLLFFSDESGFQNPWTVNLSDSPPKPRPVLSSPVDEDFAEPDWRLGAASSAILSEDSVLCTAIRGGRYILYLLDLKTGELHEISSPYVVMKNIRPIGPRSAVFLGCKTDSPMAIVYIELDPNSEPTFRPLVGGESKNESSDTEEVDRAFFSMPKPITFKGREGFPLHIIFYPPVNPNFTGSDGERPPCVVSAHGGPTGMEDQGFNLRKQFFTNRGFAWVDVNYTGSSGYGRDYIARLDGQWGVRDVTDCIDAARALASPSFGSIDPSRVVITGGSAGGYTVLQSLCSVSTDVFAAGTASYGISNLFSLAEDTHKFESRYGEKLLGGPPDKIPHILRARSPLFHAEKIKAPLLILQGADDKVVPPTQAESMLKVIRDRGGRVEYELFEGEGHGWRKAETIIAALEREVNFYLDALKITEKKDA